MAKRVFVGNGEKDPSLVGGGEMEPQAGAPCPGHPQPRSRRHTTSLEQVRRLRCDVSLARGAQSRKFKKQR